MTEQDFKDRINSRYPNKYHFVRFPMHLKAIHNYNHTITYTFDSVRKKVVRDLNGLFLTLQCIHTCQFQIQMTPEGRQAFCKICNKKFR